jgi:hypothetical protein
MRSQRSTSSTAQCSLPPYPSVRAGKDGPAAGDRPWLRAFIETVDRRLRRQLGVNEYTRSSNCVLRIQIIRNTHHLLLKDGTCVRPGERIVNLHFWNEQIPLIPAAGPTLGWARRMNVRFEQSLRELVRHLAARNDMDDVVAIRAKVALGAAARSGKISHILSRFGFEIMPQQDSPSIAGRLHQCGENILISLFVLACNAIALRRDTLMRGRVVAYLSRRALEQRYGRCARREQFHDADVIPASPVL